MGAGIAAYFMLAVMNVFAKLLSENHHVIEIAFYRNLIAVMPFLFMIFVLNKRDIIKINSRKKSIIARAVIGTMTLCLTFGAFAAMPMAETTAFLFTASLIIPILGFFFLGEKVGIYRWGAVLIGFIGVLIMLSFNGAITPIGITLALSAAFFQACLGTLLRSLGRTEKPETITFYFVLIGTFLAAIPLPFVASMPSLSEIPLFLGVGLTGLIAQYLLSIAFGNAPAAVVTVFNYSGIIWATIFGWLIWSDWPAHTIWIGGAREVTGDRVRAKL